MNELNKKTKYLLMCCINQMNAKILRFWDDNELIDDKDEEKLATKLKEISRTLVYNLRYIWLDENTIDVFNPESFGFKVYKKDNKIYMLIYDLGFFSGLKQEIRNLDFHGFSRLFEEEVVKELYTHAPLKADEFFDRKLKVKK